MSSDAQFDSRLKEIARAAAPGESIADRVMRHIDEDAEHAHAYDSVGMPPGKEPPVRESQAELARESHNELVRESLLATQTPLVRESLPAPRTRRYITIATALTGLAAGLLLGIGLGRLAPTTQIAPTLRPALPIQIASVEGTVLVKRPSGSWAELAPAAPLYVGDLYQATPQSQMKLTFKDGSWLTLAGSSRVALDHYNGDVRLNLSHGTLKASLNSPHPPFIVATPTGRIEALGTEFTVSVE